MELEDCKIGLPVRLIDDKAFHGTISKIVIDKSGEWVFIDFDEKVKMEYTTTELIIQYRPRELETFDAEMERKHILQVQKLVDRTVDAFSTAFEAFKEATDYADHNLDGLLNLKYSKLVDFSKLEGVIDSGGWRSSSLYC